MAANASEESSDRISAASSDITTSSNLTTTAEEKLITADNAKEEDEKVVAPDVRQEMASAAPPATTTGQLGNADATGERSISRPSNIYAPQAHTIYYSGYNSPSSSDWDEYFQYVNQEGMELNSPNIYRESPSLLFHTGYGYNPQVPYGAYSPVATPLPSTGGDGHLYSPQQFPLSAPYYQQPLPVNLSFLNSPTPVSQPDRTVTAGMEQQVTFPTETPNSNSSLFGKKPDHSASHGTFSRGNFSGNTGDPGYYDFRQGFDGYGGGGPWSEWLKSPDAQKSWTPFYSPIASSQPIYSHGSLGHNANPFASGPAPYQPRPFHSVDRGYSHGTIYPGSNFGVSYGVNDRGWIANDKSRRRGKGDTSLYRSNDTPDYLSEQSRGPRATKPKSLVTEQNSLVDSNKKSTSAVHSRLYNQPDFAVEHKNAKFFIIKSYSEDNVHKSIKYGVWASTPNGNRKLDAACREAKDKGGPCPVFLFFSVNSSAQFCGVAEMTGPVDFDKSVDYWQQDKWSGQFPVKWHIVKDVPNSQFRHIILENNDKKPVTNSRDTQEVNLEQGLEMLTLFKEYEYETSILDDFDFYEERQKAMQERRAMQQQQQSYTILPHLPGSSADQRHQISSSVYHVNHLQKDFSHMVRLDETKKESVIVTANGSNVAEAKPTDMLLKLNPRIPHVAEGFLTHVAEAKPTDKTDAAIESTS